MSAALEALKARFLVRCGEDRARLAEAAAAGDADALKSLSHKLAGAAGTFGFPELSAAAMAVEDALDAGDAPGPELLAALDARLAETARP